MAHKLVSKAEAKRLELKTYQGKPCDRGHSGERYTNSDKCIECHAERNKRRTRGKTRKPPKVRAGLPVVPTVETPITDDWQSYADKIIASLQEAVESIVEAGRLLIEAKSKVEHGDWLEMIEALPFSEHTAQRLMAIARHPIISNTEHRSVFPPSWGTLYELTRLPDDVLLDGIKDHRINPEMQRKDVAAITNRDPKTKVRSKSSKDQRLIEQAEEMERLKAYNAELEAARDVDYSPSGFDAFKGDLPTLASRLVSIIGKERAALLIVELQKLLGGTSSPDPLPGTPSLMRYADDDDDSDDEDDEDAA